MTLEDVIALNDEIAALVRAGVPLETGLAQLQGDLPRGLRQVTAMLAERTARGESLAEAIRTTLKKAIRAGGSSLRNYVSADGSRGYFQLATMCYGREGLPCRVCKTPIRAIRQGQRSTFFCPRCQR